MSSGRSVRPIGLTDGMRTISASSCGNGGSMNAIEAESAAEGHILPLPSIRAAAITARPIQPEPHAMKIHEYQAKELLAAAGANTPKHIVVKSPEEAAAAFDQLSNGGGVMVKAQIHAGGRGAGQLLGYPEKFGG